MKILRIYENGSRIISLYFKSLSTFIVVKNGCKSFGGLKVCLLLFLLKMVVNVWGFKSLPTFFLLKMFVKVWGVKSF